MVQQAGGFGFVAPNHFGVFIHTQWLQDRGVGPAAIGSNFVTKAAWVGQTRTMILARSLTVVGLASLVGAGLLARRYLLTDRGLRRAFGGLLLSASAGLGIAFSKTSMTVWPLALIMLGGIAFLVYGMHAENKRKNGNLF